MGGHGVDNGKTIAFVIRYGDDCEFYSAIIVADRDECVAILGWFRGFGYCCKDVGVSPGMVSHWLCHSLLEHKLRCMTNGTILGEWVDRCMNRW